MFLLRYKELVIGTLISINGEWHFTYSDDFKSQSEIKPLVDFSNVNKTYVSKNGLHPFFLIRIPSLKQPNVQETIKQKNIDVNSEIELLTEFGRKCIANPFILTPTTHINEPK